MGAHALLAPTARLPRARHAPAVAPPGPGPGMTLPSLTHSVHCHPHCRSKVMLGDKIASVMRVYAGDCVPKKKPAPDIYLLAAKVRVCGGWVAREGAGAPASRRASERSSTGGVAAASASLRPARRG